MTTHKIKRLPVMRGGQVVGIVSRADIVNAIALGEAPWRCIRRFTISKELLANTILPPL